VHLTRIRLTNVGVHAELDMPLGLGLNGVFGPNGSGKSTIFSAAYAALTGDFARFRTKGNMARVGAPKRAYCGVDVEFVHYGRLLRVVRAVSSNACTLDVDGQTVAQNATEVERALVQEFKIDFHLLDAYGFIKQEEIAALLQVGETERAKAFQRLCGTAIMQPIYKGLGRAVEEAEAKLAPSVDVQRLAARVDELRREIGILDGEIAALKAATPEAAVVESWRRLAMNAKRRTELEASIASGKGERRTLKERIASLDESIAAEEAIVAKYAADVDEARLDRLLDQKSRAAAWAQQQVRRQSLTTKLADLEAKLMVHRPPLTPEGYRESGEILKELSPKKSKLKELDDGLAALAGRGAADCPTCHKPFGPDDIDQMRSDANLLRTQISDLRAEIKEAEAFEERQIAARHVKLTLERDRERVAEDLQELGPEPEITIRIAQGEAGAPEDLDAEIQRIRQAVAKTKTAAEELSRLNPQRDSLLAAWDLSKSRHDEWTKDLEGLPESGTDVDAKLAGYAAQTTALAEAQGTRRAHAKNLERTETDLAEGRTLERGAAQRSRKLRWLREARRLAAPDGLSRDVAVANLRAMTDAVNAFLSSMGATFWLQIEDDMSFTAVFPDGRVIPASLLSVGLKVILSICLRRAIGDLFGHTGPIFMDEPTASLDGRYISSLREFLSRLAADVRGQRQIVVITHAEQLRNCFDQVFDLEERIADAA
jgi:exonuclease SbcC